MPGTTHDGNIIAIGSSTLSSVGHAWNRSAGTSIDLGSPVGVVGISRDGKRLIAAEPADPETGGSGALRLYATEEFTVLAETFGSIEGFNRGSLEFSPDGQRIAGIVGELRHTIRFIDAETLGAVDNLFDPHEFGTTDFDFDSDGSRLATVGEDGFARIWDADTLVLVHEIQLGSPGAAVNFVDDDSVLAVSTASGGVRLYHLELADLLSDARERLVRGFTTTECRVYFGEEACPTLEDVLGG